MAEEILQGEAEKQQAILAPTAEERKQRAIINTMFAMYLGLLPSPRMTGVLVGIHVGEDDGGA